MTDSKIGVVAIFVKNTYLVSERKDLKITNSESVKTESTWLEIKNTRREKTIISVIYRHPKGNVNNFSEKLEQSLSILAKDKSICHKIITIDLIKFEFHTSTGDYLEMLMQNGFLPTVLLPTRVTNHSCTLIDHIYYSTPRNITQFKCGDLLTGMSDHFASFFILYTSKNSKKKLESRPMVRLFSEQNK